MRAHGRKGLFPLSAGGGALSPDIVGTRPGHAWAVLESLVISQEFLSEHVVEGSLRKDFDSRPLKG